MNNKANKSKSTKWTFERMSQKGSNSRPRLARAQAMVEFALLSPLVLIGLVVGIQFAIFGAGALALSQAAYQGARYASINGSATNTNVKSALDAVVSPIIKSNYSMAPITSPRATGTTVKVTLTWDATKMIVLPNPFFGINFPTSFSATESAYTE